jgi:AraC-like DNA-binding protein
LLPITQARAATTFVYTQLGHKGLGFAYARALRVTLHGPVSLIALSSKNLREVITALERYFSLRAPAFQLHAEIGDDYVTIRIEYPGKNDPLRPFLMESLLIGLVVMAAQILDQTPAGAEIHMQGAAPSYYAALAPHLPVPVRYEQPEYAILVPRFLMEKPLRLSDPTAASMAREACERQLQARQNSHDDMLTTRVRSVLTASQDQLPTLEEVATALHVSTRTLKRRLQEEGRNFRALVDHVLLERATQMFTEEGLSVSEVAFRLGYTDVSNFSRAFRRWTGVSPSDFRKEH